MNKNVCLIFYSKPVHFLVHIFIILKGFLLSLVFLKISRPFIVTLCEACEQPAHTMHPTGFEDGFSLQCKIEWSFIFFKCLHKSGLTIFLFYYLVYIGTFKRLLELCILMLNRELKPLSKLLDTCKHCFSRIILQ